MSYSRGLGVVFGVAAIWGALTGVQAAVFQKVMGFPAGLGLFALAGLAALLEVIVLVYLIDRQAPTGEKVVPLPPSDSSSATGNEVDVTTSSSPSGQR